MFTDVSSSTRAAVTKQTGRIQQHTVIPHGSARRAVQDQGADGLVLGESALPHLQVATISLCARVTSLCPRRERGSESEL